MFSEAFAVAPRPISEMPANLDLRPIGLVLSALEKRHGLAPKGPLENSSAPPGRWRRQTRSDSQANTTMRRRG
jgi:hypothetical protein